MADTSPDSLIEWGVELYKVVFLLTGGSFIGWAANNAVTERIADTTAIALGGGTTTPAYPDWALLLLVPAVLWVLYDAISSTDTQQRESDAEVQD